MAEPKEPTFFMLDEEYSQGVNYYRSRYFNHCQDATLLGDARTNHLFLPWVPNRIKETFPEAKLIAVLRDPVERAYSDYYHARRHAAENRSFEKALMTNYRRLKSGRRLMTSDERQQFQHRYKSGNTSQLSFYLDRGYYAEMISRYKRHFPAKRIKLIKFEDLIGNPLETCNEIFDFLGLSELNSLGESEKNTGTVPRSYWLQSIYRSLGDSKIANFLPSGFKNKLMNLNLKSKSRVPPMESLTRHWLAQHFEPYNNRLEQMVNFDLSEWTTPCDLIRRNQSDG